ncbi:MAG: hypothetical protein IKP71_05980, partial [Candidatus Riflebacteria bacterium]|nr:hypothetical protein [Candidatus Riflebacteria bacterium]
IHRDIKPSNFGLETRNGELREDTVKLFDIDSICSVYDTIDKVVYTIGFSEPTKDIDNQTDIYSIGATLFNAVIVTDEVKKNRYIYKNEYEDRLLDMVKESKLIHVSKSNSDRYVIHYIAKILKNCLCEKSNRYQKCEDLLEDLKNALKHMPSGLAGNELSVENSLAINRKKNSFLAIQYHLYKNPLYPCCSEEKLTILIIGFGNYGQSFLDACLQNGQILNKKLHVIVVSDNALSNNSADSDKDIYLEERPELENFFNIDSSLRRIEATYGDIDFKQEQLEKEKQNTKLQEIIQNHKPNYIFIALGDDKLNSGTAETCQKIITYNDIKCIISYVCERNNKKAAHNSLYPVLINQNIKEQAIYKEIERMAFNTHLIWEKNLNIDLAKIRNEFLEKYNHDSCVSCVLSMKYKLYSIGINLDEKDLSEAARVFSDKISENNTIDLKNQLMWIEHRRWVTEKLCQGWQQKKVPDDFTEEDFTHGKTKDGKHKKHICIVRSRPNQLLATEYKSCEDWDKKSDEQLDELDKLSLKLHREYIKRAEKTKKELKEALPLFIDIIKNQILGNTKAISAFNEWSLCFNDIKDNVNRDIERIRSEVKLYEGLKTSFLN